MIGQSIGLEFLVPIAIRKLANNALVEGDFYPGDLLVYVLSVEQEYWDEHHVDRDAMRDIIDRNPDAFEKTHSIEDIMRHLNEKRSHWLDSNGS